MDTIEVLDLSKENILPLRQGRRASHLKTALQAQVDPETQLMLQKKREEYEFLIRMYEGNDPLEPYYNYVIWLEQSFPKMGRENNVVQLLEDTLIKFKDIERYKQDSRLIQLLIKYLSIQSNPLELYKLVYDQGLGTMCTLLYKAWAEEYEKINDIKGADEIYKLGIKCRAQPLNELENAHVQFQLSVARRMIDGTLSPAKSVESSRTALSKLKLSSVKSSRISHDSAGILPSKKADEKRRNSNSLKFSVYENENDESALKRDFEKTEKFPRGSVSNRENIMQAGKWCGQKQKQSSKLSRTPLTPSFHIHEDPEAACSNMKKTDYRPRALKLRKDDFNPPIAVFEPPDPTKKPMYPKQLVYVGGRDVQLEEIQAAHYWRNLDRNLNENEHQLSATKNETGIDMTQKDSHVSTKENEEVHARDLSAPHSESNFCFPSLHHSPSTSMTVNTRAAVHIIQQMWESPLSQDAGKMDNGSRLSSTKSTFPVYLDSSSVLPQIGNSIPVFNDENEPKSSTPFQVYTDDLATPIDDDLLAPPSPTPSIHSERNLVKAPMFDVFCDENLSAGKPAAEFNFKTPNSKSANSLTRSANFSGRSFDNFTSRRALKPNADVLSVFLDGSDSIRERAATCLKNDFAVTNDENEKFGCSAGSSRMGNEQDPSNAANTPLPLIIPVNLQDTPLESENKENQPPLGYTSPSDCRPLSGILTPSTNIQFEDQASDDSDHDDERSEAYAKYLDMDRDTCTTEAFFVPLPTSTPFSIPKFHQEKPIYDRSYASDENVRPSTGCENTRRKALEFQQMIEKSKKPNFTALNLSSILENSKETGGFSSGSSCKQ